MRSSTTALSTLQQRLLNDYQQDFPLSPTPYRDIAQALGVQENDVLKTFTELAENNLIARIGPVIAPNRIGASTLAAMAVPVNQLQQTAEIINGFPEVNHNYEREHDFNLWFVAVAANEQRLRQVIAEIEDRTGFKVMCLPLLEDYFINLGFELDFNDNLR